VSPTHWPFAQVKALFRDSKQQAGGDVRVHANISVAQALLAADVVMRRAGVP
jgi:hypothetical protein